MAQLGLMRKALLRAKNPIFRITEKRPLGLPFTWLQKGLFDFMCIKSSV